VNSPNDYRIDPDLPCDNYGNLISYQVNILPPNAEVTHPESKPSRAEQASGERLLPTDLLAELKYELLMARKHLRICRKEDDFKGEEVMLKEIAGLNAEIKAERVRSANDQVEARQKQS